ncbi:MAG TPA: hypothetical protein VGD41_17500 [Pyrinomonadaceae bacterium]|jgi:hypothetical protein
MKHILVLLLLGFALSFCKLSEKLHGGSSNSGSSSSSSSSSRSAEHGQPTAAQTAALAGGQQAKWERQGMSWTVPAGWTESENESKSFLWRSPGGGDAANLIVSISPMDESFPVEAANDASYEQAKSRAKNGEVDEVKWVEIDGLTGVLFREANPEHPDGSRRLQWLSYRKYLGQVQGINVMLATQGKDFERHKDAMYGILYSMKVTH